MTKLYLVELYRAALEDVRKDFGSVKGNTIVLLVGGIATAGVLAIAAYVGFENGIEAVLRDLSGLFLGDLILIISLWLVTYVIALLRMPNVAASRDFAKSELIRTLSTKEKPEIAQLAKLRTKGVDLRNKVSTIETELQLETWIKAYEQWNTQLLRLAKKISPATADWLRTLDTMPARPPVQAVHWVNNEHIRYARIWSEKLQRLDIVIRGQLGLAK
jgi:hypothetical protein